MKKRFFALMLALLLALTAVPAMAGGFLFSDFNNFFNDSEAAVDSESGSGSLVIIDKPKETKRPTQAPIVTAEPAPVVTEKPDQQVSTGEASSTTPYGRRIFDDADLFTPAQEADINRKITQFQKETGMDFVVVTYNGPMKMASAQDEADVFYEEGCRAGMLGNVEKPGDDEDSGMLLYINPEAGEYHVSTTGKMIDYITDSRGASLNSDLGLNLRSARHTGNYALCVTDLISGTTRYVKAGIPEGQYQYDIITGQQLTARHKALTGMELLVSGGIGLVVCIIFVTSVNGQYSLKHNTYEYSPRSNASISIRRRGDQYIRSTVNRVRRPDERSSGGGYGGGGFGGGSGVHTSSGGGSHGGFGGKF